MVHKVTLYYYISYLQQLQSMYTIPLQVTVQKLIAYTLSNCNKNMRLSVHSPRSLDIFFFLTKQCVVHRGTVYN